MSGQSKHISGGARLAVIGGGPVGILQALLLAKKGFKVDVYEKREDIRKTQQAEGRSINLTLSVRGRDALREVGLEGVVLEHTQPVHSRMIHSVSGVLSTQRYDSRGQCLYSVDRLKLNKLLLSQAENNPNVTLHFKHKLSRADLVKKELTILRAKQSKHEEEEIHVKHDFIFGCDGAHSFIRRQMMRLGKMDYAQEYIDHGYKELTMPPIDGKYAMDENYLHIWARGEFMMIALPNQDQSFTLTLFMPFKIFQSIKNKEDLLAFFMKHFPDSVLKIGEDKLVQDYFCEKTGDLTCHPGDLMPKPGDLISVKCKPYFMANSTLILGDAAHAIVPFYGQGVNTGFEDCLIFYEHLAKTDNDIVQAASEYSEKRWQDCHAIADLSMYNYMEIRSHVNSRTFHLRKSLDNLLHFIFPRTFTPLYSMVAFTRIPYREVVEQNSWQKRVVDSGLYWLKVVAIGIVLFLLCLALTTFQ